MLKAEVLNYLQEVNGVIYTSSAWTEDSACKRFIGFTDEALRERLKVELAEADFISLLVDETTDNTNHKVALIYVFFVKEGMFTERMLAIIIDNLFIY